MTSFNRRSFLTTAAAVFIALSAKAPVSAQTYCGISNRECIVFIAELDSKDQTQAQKNFYNFLEAGHEAVIVSALSSRYNKLTIVKGSASTLGGLVKTLHDVTSKSSVRAVDLMFVAHGLDTGAVFYDATHSMRTVRKRIRDTLSWSRRQKLRMVYSTACYGSSHQYYWRSAGFKTACGSRRISADTGLSLPVFLSAWSGMQTFYAAVTAGNASDPFRVQDNIAKQLLLSWNYEQWWDVNSVRNISGVLTMKITHRPY